ncbi:MAG: SCO family protein [Gemmatimonas sp.]
MRYRSVFRAVCVALIFIMTAGSSCDSVTRTSVDRSAQIAIPNVDGAKSDDTNSIYQLSSAWRDQTSHGLQLSELAGRVRIFAMVYTNCHTTCPLIIADLKRIEAAIPANRRDEVGFVLVSLDVPRDTPAALAQWAASIGLDTKHWTLLAGSSDAVRELAATFDVRYERQQNGEVAHSNGITVLDTRGSVVFQQPGPGSTAATLLAINSLLN